MRLTPSWFRSSTDTPSEERSEDSTSPSGVTVYYPPQTDTPEGDTPPAGRVREFVPESDTALLSILDEMNMPVTVDEIADTLIEPRRPPIETWAAVHERLYEDRLPALDASKSIEFDETQGLVDRDAVHSGESHAIFPAVVAVISLGILLAVATFVSASMLFAMAVSLVTTVFAVWFVPGFV